MKKIILIGSGGSGKSTLALRLGHALGIGVSHLDLLLWRPGWSPVGREAGIAIQREIIASESWIIDGNYEGTLPLRAAAADTVILLDLPPLLCAWRVIIRRLSNLGRTRPDMAEGCPERPWLSRADREFIARVWNFREKSLPSVRRVLQEYHDGGRVITFRSVTEIDRFIDAIERGTPV